MTAGPRLQLPRHRVRSGRRRVPIARTHPVRRGGARDRGDGVSIAYATNNAGREPAVVAAQLRELGLDAPTDSVVNSSMAGAAYLADSLPADATVLAVRRTGGVDRSVGSWPAPGEGKRRRSVGGREAAGHLQGYGPEVSWRNLAVAAFAIQAGAQWVATNLEAPTIPPVTASPPATAPSSRPCGRRCRLTRWRWANPRPRCTSCARGGWAAGDDQILAIGDRLDTDIIGANRAGMPSLLVTTGVHQVEAVCAADDESRPRYLAVASGPCTRRTPTRSSTATATATGGPGDAARRRCPCATARWSSVTAIPQNPPAGPSWRWCGPRATPANQAPATTLGIDDETSAPDRLAGSGRPAMNDAIPSSPLDGDVMQEALRRLQELPPEDLDGRIMRRGNGSPRCSPNG